MLVTNGVYQTGGRAAFGLLTNRVAVRLPLIVRSVNGAEATAILGHWDPVTTNSDTAVRCAYLTNGAVLSGFSLRNGATRASGDLARERSGSAVYCESSAARVVNCQLSGNSAYQGGAAYAGTLVGCTLSSNSAFFGGATFYSDLENSKITSNSGYYGGGACYSLLNNCTIVTNSSYYGGGAYGGVLNNCIIYYNSAVFIGGPNFSRVLDLYYFLHNCCTFPSPDYGAGNFTNAPLFTDLVNGDLHLQSNSPCINAGLNAYTTAPSDFDGNPRVVAGVIDVGAYEFQSPSSAISYAWLQQFGLPTDGSADLADPDADGLNNWQEWLAGTDPTQFLSGLRLLPPQPSPLGVVLSWTAESNRTYALDRSTNLGARPNFLPWRRHIVGQTGIMSFIDTTVTNISLALYRVRVE